MNNYLEGYIYHMTHIDNLEDIFSRRAILSKRQVLQRQYSYHSIALEDVQNLRDRIFIWNDGETQYRSLHSYVPFYFVSRTPMLYKQYKMGIQDEIVFFEVSRQILYEHGVAFTDGNASNQQLSNYAGECVNIIPSAGLVEDCQREYFPTGPHGTNAKRSNFYCNVECLQLIDWEVVTTSWYGDENKKRIKHAEVLVPDLLPLGKIAGIATRDQQLAQRVNLLIKDFGLTARIPFAVSKPGIYF